MKRAALLPFLMVLVGLVVLPVLAAADDLSKPEVLNVYLLGPEPTDMASVSAELNKLTQKDLNATVKWTFLGWDKWDQKYALALTSGEPISLIYTANWADFPRYAKAGAFLPLNDLLPKAAPMLWTKATKAQWLDATVNGKIYTVPNDWKEYQTNELVYRADVAKKLGFSKPLASIDDIEKFLAAAKKASPNTIPFNGEHYTDLRGVEEGFFAMGKYDYVERNTFYLLRGPKDRLLSWYETPEYLKYAQMMKRWRDLGYVARDSLSAKIIASDNFKNGNSVVANDNPTKADAMYRSLAADHPDWELGSVVYSQLAGYVHPNAWIGNGMALPKSSPNPERALAFVQKLRYDPDYYRLTNYGILGKHYNLDANGNVLAIADSGFGYQAMQPWGWHVDAQELPTLGGWPLYKPIYAALDKIATPNSLSTFAFDPAPVQAAVAAVKQVEEQYFYPIDCGIAADPVKATQEAIAKLKAAGLDKVKAEMQKQIDAYLAERAKN